MKSLFSIGYLMVGFCLCTFPVWAEDIHAPKPAPENLRRIMEENRYPAFVRECLAEAIPKLQKRAEAKEAILKKETIKVDGIDDRWDSSHEAGVTTLPLKNTIVAADKKGLRIFLD